MQLTNALLVSLLAASGAQAAALHRRVALSPSRVNGTMGATEPMADLADLITKLEKQGKIQWKNTPSGAQMATVAESIIKAAAKGGDGDSSSTTTSIPMSTGTGTAKTPKIPKKAHNVRAAPAPGASGTPDKLSIAGMEATVTCAKPKEEHLAAGVPQDQLVNNANLACNDFAADSTSSAPVPTGTTGTTGAAAANAYHIWRPKAQPTQPAQPIQPVQPGQPQQPQQQAQQPGNRGAIVWYQGVGTTPTKLTPDVCQQALQVVSDPQKSKCTGQGHSASISMAVGGVVALGDKKKGGLNIGVNAMEDAATTAPKN